ncbi:hypothetical protein [Pikeienuella sp. HZG-20]|uniref:hypothetical protein n=1 Tax=Paludibacillus litoralis TaxID=3133267 RepID=UPI0030ED3ECA
MTIHPPRNLFDKQVDLTRYLIKLRHSMDERLAVQVMPHLDERARDIVRDLLEHVQEKDAVHPDLLVHLDATIKEVRDAIAAGKIVEKVPIPRELLIGCSEAFHMRTSYTPAADALRAALPPMEHLKKAAREVHEFSEAIRQSLDLLQME